MTNNPATPNDVYAYIYTYDQNTEPLSEITRSQFILRSIANRKLIGRVLQVSSEPINNSYLEAKLFSMQVELPLTTHPINCDFDCIIIRQNTHWTFYPCSRIIDKCFIKEDNTAYFKFIASRCCFFDNQVYAFGVDISDLEMENIKKHSKDRLQELHARCKKAIENLRMQSNEVAKLIEELQSINITND